MTMDTSIPNERLLLADIDRLREQFPLTQDLYREVCILLFFRYGMTPTANKLYQLVRKGSMTAPAEALGKFWGDLREKSRVRIEHPDLPETLKTAAGELTATLWSAARAMADETLASFRSEAQASVAKANTALESAQAERDGCRAQLAGALRTSDAASLRISALEQNLAAMTATNTAIELQLLQTRQDSAADIAAHLEGVQLARREFTAELDKLRAANQLAEERFRGGETRALLEMDRERSAGVKLQKEIDRERTAVVKLQKEVDSVRESAHQAAERHGSDLGALQAQLGDHRQKAGMLEGSLQAVTANRDMLSHEFKTVQAQLTDQLMEAGAQALLARAETESWRNQAQESRRMLSELQARRTRTAPRPKAG